MPETNPYQAPQASLTSAAVPVKLRELVPWDEDSRRALHEVATGQRRMMGLYLAFLGLGCSSIINTFAIKEELLVYVLTLPMAVVYFTLVFQVYQLAKLLNNSWTPLVSLLAMLLLPYSLAVPIIYQRRAVQFFAHWGIQVGLLGIRPQQLDTRIDAAYDAFQRNSAST